MPDELFRSDDVLVRKVGDHGRSCCVVTFDSFTDFRTLDRPGFGEQFLNASGIDAIHVIPRDNDWYQYPEMEQAMACVQATARRYARVVTYGSSMGGYAAIRLAGLAGAQAVLALSPQFSIDPAIVPWEGRWLACSQRFASVWEHTLPFPSVGEAYVVYDAENIDHKHMALLEQRLRFTAIPIPHAGHPVTGYLAEVGLLQQSILALCHRSFEANAFEREARARRRQSAQYLVTLAEGNSPKRRTRRIALMRQAVAIAPTNAAIACRLGLELGMAGQFEESLRMHRRSLDLAPNHPNMLVNCSLSLEHSGDLDAALAVMEDLSIRTDHAAIYQPRLIDLRGRVAARDAPPPVAEMSVGEPAAAPAPAPSNVTRPRRGWLLRWLRARSPKLLRGDSG